MDPIIDQEELRSARAEGIEELATMARALGKKAPVPAKKQAMAELEATLERVRRDWEERGLVAA